MTEAVGNSGTKDVPAPPKPVIVLAFSRCRNMQIISEGSFARWHSAACAHELSKVKPGSHLVAYVDAPVYESPESWRCVGEAPRHIHLPHFSPLRSIQELSREVPAGVRVIAMGSPRVVEGR